MRALLALLIALPAHAGVILTVEAPQGRIDLYQEQGQCLGDAHQALFTDRSTGAKIPGCWAPLNADVVQIAFMDADIAHVPTKDFKRPAEG